MTRGFDYDPHFVLTDLARLVAYVASSESLARRASFEKDEYFPISELRKAEVFDTHRILIGTAVLLRERINFSAERKNRNVGFLFEGQDHRTVLTLREACNKIIHANHVDEERGPNFPAPHEAEPPVLGGLTGKLHLYGSRGKNEWRAELDIYRFCFGAYWAL